MLQVLKDCVTADGVTAVVSYTNMAMDAGSRVYS